MSEPGLVPVCSFSALRAVGWLIAGVGCVAGVGSPSRPANPLRGSFAGYRLRRRIACGGFAEIYWATTTDGQQVVLKIPWPAVCQSADLRQRFRNEGAILELLAQAGTGDALVRRLGGGTDPHTGRDFLVLEVVPGDPLKVHLASGRPAAPDFTVTVMLRVAEGLAEMHQVGVCHADLAPSNILVDTQAPQVRRVTLVDFGAAQCRATGCAMDGGVVLGQPAYMSPEQCLGRPLSAPTDVYSFGVILYELLYGRTPFVSDDPATLMAMHERGTLAPVPARPGVSEALRQLAVNALDKRPANRPHSTDVVSTLRAVEAQLRALGDCPDASREDRPKRRRPPKPPFQRPRPRRWPAGAGERVPCRPLQRLGKSSLGSLLLVVAIGSSLFLAIALSFLAVAGLRADRLGRGHDYASGISRVLDDQFGKTSREFPFDGDSQFRALMRQYDDYDRLLLSPPSDDHSSTAERRQVRRDVAAAKVYWEARWRLHRRDPDANSYWSAHQYLLENTRYSSCRAELDRKTGR